MRLCCREACRLQHGSDQFIIKPQHTVQKLAVVDVVGFLVTVELHSIGHHLLLRDVFEYKEFGIILIVVIIVSTRLIVLIVVKALGARMCTTHRRINSSIGDSGRSINRLRAGTGRQNTFALILELLKLVHYFSQLSLSFLLLDGTFTDSIHSLSVDEITCAWTASKFTIDSLPMLFEIRLNMLEPVECRHFTRLFRRWCLAATLRG